MRHGQQKHTRFFSREDLMEPVTQAFKKAKWEHNNRTWYQLTMGNAWKMTVCRSGILERIRAVQAQSWETWMLFGSSRRPLTEQGPSLGSTVGYQGEAPPGASEAAPAGGKYKESAPFLPSALQFPSRAPIDGTERKQLAKKESILFPGF